MRVQLVITVTPGGLDPLHWPCHHLNLIVPRGPARIPECYSYRC